MQTFIVTYRKRYCVDLMSDKVNAYNFSDAEVKFNDDVQEEDDLLITQIALEEVAKESTTPGKYLDRD